MRFNAEHNMLKTGRWWLVYALTWAVLYGAFAAQLDGALYVIKYLVWVLVALSPVMVAVSVIEQSVKEPPMRLRSALLWLRNWVALGLLVWFGHFATGAALGVVMLCAAAHGLAVRKRRAAA